MKLFSILILFSISLSAIAYDDDLLLGSFSLEKAEMKTQVKEPSFLVGSFSTEARSGRAPASSDESPAPQEADYSYLQGSFQEN
jgi:hypothetical protein